MLVTSPAFQTIDRVRERLQISSEKLGQIIDFLMENGLIEKKQNRLIPKNIDVHLERDSPLIAKHHTNWRMQAIRSLDQELPNELHYSLACKVAARDNAEAAANSD